MDEKRRAARQRCDFCASMVLDGGNVLRCKVVDFSVSGAQLQVPSVLGVPDEFMLRAPTGGCRRVQVKRRGIARVGVAFI